MDPSFLLGEFHGNKRPSTNATKSILNHLRYSKSSRQSLFCLFCQWISESSWLWSYAHCNRGCSAETQHFKPVWFGRELWFKDVQGVGKFSLVVSYPSSGISVKQTSRQNMALILDICLFMLYTRAFLVWFAGSPGSWAYSRHPIAEGDETCKTRKNVYCKNAIWGTRKMIPAMAMSCFFTGIVVPSRMDAPLPLHPHQKYHQLNHC